MIVITNRETRARNFGTWKRLLTSRLVDSDKREGAALLDLPMDNAVRGTDIDIPGRAKAWLVDLERNCLASKPFDESAQESRRSRMRKRGEIPIAIIVGISGVHHDRDALPSPDVSGH